MKTILMPIAHNELSYNVNLLQKALKALGLPVTKSEAAHGRAGEDTLKKVRTLQAQLNVPVDESTLVDEATSMAIAEAMKQRSLTTASRSFTVTGTVRLPNGSVKKRQRLLAFDLDLRAVAVYRTLKKLAEIQKNGGFEFLGEAVSNNLGIYSITFYDWQYRKAERSKADVVVYALEGEEISGCSRMVNSEDYSDKGLVRDLDVIITQEDKRTEYEALMHALNVFLEESKTTLSEIAKSQDQLVFTAGELDVDLAHLSIAASAELLAKREEKQLLPKQEVKQISHQLLYGIGRQNIGLSWPSLYKKQEDELHQAIAKSVDERIIRKFQEKEITVFLHDIQQCSTEHQLDDNDEDNKNTLNVMLKNALPEKKQRLSFVNALGNFKGSDYREFWNEYLPAQPEFQDKPELISGLLLTQQFTLLTGNNQALVNELQVNSQLTSVHQLMELEKDDWLGVIKKTGVPDFIAGKNEEEKINRYADLMQGQLNAAFPTQRIAKMVEKNELPTEQIGILKSIGTFLTKNEQFDIASSRILDFDSEIKAAAGDDFNEVRSELMKIQRVFQVSASPGAMKVLMENNLHSAYTIANIPRKNFIKTYGNALGDEHTAFAIHQRASHISIRAEMAAMHLMEYSHGQFSEFVVDKKIFGNIMTALQNKIPNYSELFGSPDICECEHCRSVYSAAAYFVDLLRFLWRGEPNSNGKTPLDMLKGRRPDLLHLPLTCENTNTLIPYIDLVNEVMEYYVAKGSLTNFQGYDTGEATAEELRANPQNFNLEAYHSLNDAKYPFSLPYHQPLDVIRTYSDHLKVSRCEAMKAINPQPDSTTARAIEAESLGISREEYIILTGESFDGTADSTPLHEYFGCTAAGDLENMSAVREFLRRSGIVYTDLVELIKTQFINPYQNTLDFLEKIFSYASIDANTIYIKLEQIDAGTLNPADDTDISAALNHYNSDNETSVTTGEFAQWVTHHFGQFRQVITLYEPDSKCRLDTTRIRTIQSIYEGWRTSGITGDTWSKTHRFIRLWRKTGWTLHEIDLMLAALGEGDIIPGTINKLESVFLLKIETKRPLNQLAVLWGNIDTYGNKSLYKKLFLNKAVQQIDEAFKADAWGSYLQDETEMLAQHQSAILAAFRITEEDLEAILEVAEVIDGGNPRNLDMGSDILNIQNLSTIYRYVVLAKALKMRVIDLCKLIGLFGASPFSIWDMQQEEFTNITPQHTYEFYKLAVSSKQAGFKSSVLEYILQGTLPADSTMGLAKDKILQTAKAICSAFAAIEQDHPETPGSPLTCETLTAKLSLTFQPEIVSRFMGIVEDTGAYETITDDNLDITIPDELAEKYTYIKGSGRLTCAGIMTDTELSTLKGLDNVNANFQAAVDELYAAPETFISDNFNGVFSDPGEANAILLDHPAQATSASLDQKLTYVYGHFLPLLKSKLRQDAVTQHIAALIGLSEEAAALLIAADIDALITGLSSEGFSAVYFNDASWNTPVLERVDSTIDFSWGSAAPDVLVPVDNFSVRWKAYITAPASGEYTLVVEVEEADETFNLYLDDALILEKTTADTDTSLEVVTNLNAAQMHVLMLEYAETAQNAGARLHWKTAASALEIIPASVAYPAAILDNFAENVTVFHRAAKFISGFEISETELDHFITFKGDFADINFKALQAGHWKRINDYMTLRNAVPQAQALLTDVFALANRSNPLPAVDELIDMLHLAAAWDETNLEFLVNTHFTLGVDDFKNEIALNRLYEVMKIVTKTGVSAETTAQWGAAETDFDTLYNTAQLIKNTVKAKYEEEDWLDLAGNLSNKIRENQKQALISYLLMRPAIQDAGVEDADGLFEYFLIDVQMGACMDSSRIVQANAAVQMFVNRCLLNLESDMSSGSEKGVSPGAIDKDRWEWMKNYRVWEANRKVFLYPENWLEPEWRNNRSEFFKELESYLVQNDITERSVEQAFRNYLTSLNEVANLEVCGIYQENYDDGNLKYVHVFARTHNAPYKFFYRRWNEYRKWSAWEKVQVDIRNIESGDKSGVHLIPVMWKRRLFLFWPEFMEVQEPPSGNSSQSVEEVSDDKMSKLEPNRHWEIRLAWSEYVEGKWTPKQVSKEFIKQEYHWYIPGESAMRFATEIDDENKLYIYLATETIQPRAWYLEGCFKLSDIASKVYADSGGYGWAHEQWDQAYSTNFMNVSGYSSLKLLDDTYLKTATEHNLMLTADSRNFDPSFEEPFFFSDLYRTYFVRPVDIKIIEWIKRPEYFNFCFMGNFASGRTNRSVIWDASGTGNADTAGTRAMMPSGNAAATSKNMNISVTKNYGLYIGKFNDAFGSVSDLAYGDWRWWFFRYDKGLEFHTFYHPFSSEYVKNLNHGGLPGLMESDTEISSDEGTTFEDAYDPNFTNGLVQKPPGFDTRTYYKENVCFDVYGANSLYNWELFLHAPLYIATRLSKNGKYEEAMKWFHYIFDPTTDEMPGAGESKTSRYWKVLPFKTTPIESLEDWFRSLSPNTDPNTENAIIGEWRDSPFDPHLIASNRPLAYMKHVVIKYVENLIDWGDSLFRQFTRESVNEALQIYVIANHILGPKPEFVPRRGEIKAESYYSLQDKWDDFSNAIVELENLFPYSSEVSVSSTSTGTSLLGIGPTLYFCIPANNKLLEYWDTVADRLFKIRHCQDIDGIERRLALFAPPISPEALIQAVSQGLNLGSILADLSSPPPIYRFTYLIQKANEFCADVKALCSSLLAVLEKKDAEELSRLRASHETQMLELVTAIRERQVLDAKAYKESLLKTRETASFRLQHYIDLLGNESVTVPAEPIIEATLTADSQLPVDTSIPTIETDVDESLVESDESGVKLITKEKEELDKSEASKCVTFGAGMAETLAGVFHLFPQLDGEGTPLGVGAGAWWGGQNLGAGTSALAKAASAVATFLSQEAAQAAKMASYIRREQDWTLQANLAAKEIIQVDKQITSADIRIQVAEKELENHKKQIENSEEVELFLKDKFTNQELYQWMKEQLFAVYKQSYNLAHDMAKKAEKAYKYEMGTEISSFIQYGYWDNSRQGLAAGEKLQLALRQLEKSYLEENIRELELSKNISLVLLNPLALIELRETGKCYVSLPEELFDLDFQGHYFRRIKSVSLSIPCIAGPYTTVNCSLRLLKNTVRINPSMIGNGESKYEHENDEGLWIDDNRFRSSNVPVTSIATTTGQNDAGMFELNFRDERYLPFEGAGAISDWMIELTTEKNLRQFDYSTISDVILHLKYTARESGGLFKKNAVAYIKDFIMNAAELADQPMMRMFNMKQEFPTEWHKFLHPATGGSEQVLSFTIGKERFPFFTQNRDIVVMKIDVFAKCTQEGDYHMILSYINLDKDTVISPEDPPDLITLTPNPGYGGLNNTTINVNDAELDLDSLDITGVMNLKVKNSTATDYTSLATEPDEEVKDIFLVFHYKMS
jgi:hypothetical protein